MWGTHFRAGLELSWIHHGQLERGVVAGAGVDGDGRGFVVRGFGLHDIGHEGLRIAIVEREPGALNFDHDGVAGFEDVVYIVKAELVLMDGAGGECGGVVVA